LRRVGGISGRGKENLTIIQFLDQEPILKEFFFFFFVIIEFLRYNLPEMPIVFPFD